MSVNDDLKAKVEHDSNPVYASNYEDVKEAYREKYGQRWIGHYVESLGLRDLSVKAKEDKPYLAARRSLEKYESGRTKSSFYTQEAYAKQAGKNVSPVGRSAKEITVSLTGQQGRRTRTITATFTGSDAYDFVNAPSTYKVFKQYAYNAKNDDPEGLADMFENGSEYDDDTSGAIVVFDVA